MSTKRKLFRLETSEGSADSELKLELCRFLGQIDALLWPVRYLSQASYSAQVLAQRGYHNEGLAFAAEGEADAATWKHSQRTREALAMRGWVEQMANGKLKITDAGDKLARQMAELPTIDSDISRLLFAMLNAMPEDRTDGWLSEVTLLGEGEDWKDTDGFQSLTEAMLPLLVFRYAEAVSSTGRRVFYRRLQDELPEPGSDEGESYSEAGSEIYTNAYLKGMKQKQSLRYAGAQVVIPLSWTK